MNQYVIIGLGSFGHSVAVHLARKGHEVLAIDAQEQRVDAIKDVVSHSLILDVLVGGESLSEFVSESTTAAIVNLGDKIEANTLAIFYLKEIGVKHIIVKTIQELHAKIYLKMGATEIINPEEIAGSNLADCLSNPNLVDSIPLTPEFGIYELAVPDKYIGKSIRAVDFRKKHKIEIIGIKNIFTDDLNIMPSPDRKFEPDSVILCLCKKTDFKKLSL